MGNNLDLGAGPRDRLNAMLDGCFWSACAVDRRSQIVAAVVELIGVHFEHQRIGDAYPVTLVCHPVNRIAVSYKVDGRVRPLDIDDLNSALQEFGFREIDDWDLIDPPASMQFLWREHLSLDVIMDRRKRLHLLEMWQDEGPFQALNLAAWFQDLFLLDANLSPLSLEDLEVAHKRGAQFASHGWLRTGVVPTLDTDVLLAKVREVQVK